MFRRDYILEMFEQLSQAIARIVFYRTTNRFDEARKEIDDNCRQFFGFDAGALRMMGGTKILAILAPNGGGEVEKCVAAADLLRELGALYLVQENFDDSYDCLVLAMDLYLLACDNDETLAALDMRSRFSLAFELLGEWALPAELGFRLLDVYRKMGEFAAAEDLLFDLIDDGGEEGVERGIAFYRSRATNSDEELEKGGLPRDEVEESLNQLLSRLNKGH